MTSVVSEQAGSAEASVSATATGAADPISTLRSQIDALDAAIINLVAERIQVSKQIQTARINNGGTRVELGRERQILDSYSSRLGREGMHLADAVLQVCRGQR
jgi:monofunctional chorismate mutase